MSLYSHIYTNFITHEGNEFSMIPDNDTLVSVYADVCMVQETVFRSENIVLKRVRIKHQENREYVFI